MKIEEWQNLKDGDRIRHKDFPYMPHTMLREGKVHIKPNNGAYGYPDGKFTILGEVSTCCNSCSNTTKQEKMEISLAQALLFWDIKRD